MPILLIRLTISKTSSNPKHLFEPLNPNHKNDPSNTVSNMVEEEEDPTFENCVEDPVEGDDDNNVDTDMDPTEGAILDQ